MCVHVIVFTDILGINAMHLTNSLTNHGVKNLKLMPIMVQSYSEINTLDTPRPCTQALAEHAKQVISSCVEIVEMNTFYVP